MSTKKIREVLEKVRDVSYSLTIRDMQTARKALAEVEAIEKAARYGYLMMTGDIHMAKKDEERAASEAFTAIYEQTGRSER